MGKDQETDSADYSDAKYILVLFILAIIVILFGVLVYIFSQSPQPKDANTSHKRIELNKSADEGKIPSNNQESIKNNEATTNADNGTIVNNNQDSGVRSFTLPADFDPSEYNPRSESTRSLYGEKLIREYFAKIKSQDYQSACSLTSKSICNARGNIFSFENFLNQLEDGYNLESIYEATIQPEDNEKVYCVRYNYKLKADLNQSPITEVFQYRVQMRPDGSDEISARVCEKVTKDGKERRCPIITPKKYCEI